MNRDNAPKSKLPTELESTERRVKHRFRVLSRTLFLDVLAHPKARPIFIYAGIVIGIGAALYHWLEGWGWLDSIYFVVITLTTIGYGDLHPTMPATKVITIFYSLNGIILLLMLFDVIRSLRGWEIRESGKLAKDQSES